MASTSHLCIRKYLLTTYCVPHAVPGPAVISANRRDQVSTHMDVYPSGGGEWCMSLVMLSAVSAVGENSADGRNGERQGLLSMSRHLHRNPNELRKPPRQMSPGGRSCKWGWLALETCPFAVFEEEPRSVWLKRSEWWELGVVGPGG